MCRAPTVALEIRTAVGAGCVLVRALDRRYVYMPLVLGHPLLGTRVVPNPARSSAVRHAAVPRDGVSVYDLAVDISGVDSMLIHAHYRTVIVEFVAMPPAAHEADAHVAEAVVHAAVVANVEAPVARMKHEQAVGPAPIGRRPQRAVVGSRHPRPWHPVVAIVAIGPVAGHPHQAGFRAIRLFIYRKRGRSKTHADKDTRERRCRNDREKKCQQNPACRAEKCHKESSWLSWCRSVLMRSCVFRLK
jgi:hypothetical protein